MESRLIIAGAAAVIVVVALVVLVVLLAVRSRRAKRYALAADQAGWVASLALFAATADSTVDAAPAEPELESPSAELLTPLSTGDWQPPLEPAPAARLSGVSLAERTKGFGPSATQSPLLSATTNLSPHSQAKKLEAPSAVRSAAQTADTAALSDPEPEPEYVWQPSAPESHSEVSRSVEPATTVEHSESQRPKAHASASPEDDAASPTQAESPAHVHESRLASGASAEFIEMVAPIEMWFGDYRVGVKPGSKTHAQFLKFADTLLGDLKDRGERTR